MHVYAAVLERCTCTQLNVGYVPGFAEMRQRGSHKQFRHADGRSNSTMVPLPE